LKYLFAFDLDMNSKIIFYDDRKPEAATAV
jgi:hypothetical protein